MAAGWRTHLLVLQSWGQMIWQRRGVLLIMTGVAIATLMIRNAGGFQAWDLNWYDRLLQLRPVERPDHRVLIVEFTEADLTALGQWPISDAQLAELLETVHGMGPRVVGLDLIRDLPVGEGGDRLQAAIAAMPELIGIEKAVSNDTQRWQPIPALAEAGHTGAADLLIDPDGTVRRALLSAATQDQRTLFGLGTRLALDYLAADGIELTPVEAETAHYQLGQADFRPLQSQDGGYVRIDTGGYQVMLDYRGRACRGEERYPATRCVFDTISVSELLRGWVAPDRLRDRLVLIGVSAESLQDLFYTPYSGWGWFGAEATPGVEVHATIASQLTSAALDGRSGFRFWPEWLESGLIITAAILGTVLPAVTLRHPWLATGTLIGTALLLTAGTIGLFMLKYWLPLLPVLVAYGSAAVITTACLASREQRDRRMLMGLFEKYVTPQVADFIWQGRQQLMRRGQFIGQQMPATVLFTDLAGFSGIVESTPPAVLMPWLNEYMQAMTQIVTDREGIVNKFIGDAIMAVYGVPMPRLLEGQIAEDAIVAVESAVAMGIKLQRLNQRWRMQGLPTTTMRVGIATGTVTTGCIGSARRLEYSIIGDTVNVAARLESYDKSMQGGVCRILISEETYRYIRGKFATQFVGEAILRGRKHPVKIYQVLLQ